MQLSPSASLSSIVKHYLILESEADVHLNYRLFSDGNPGIVFHFKNPLIQYSENHLPGNPQPNSFVYGQITHYNDLMSSGKLGMLVVVLEPYSIYSLLHVAAHELNNRIIKLADLFGQDALDLEEQILNEQRVDLIIRSVEKFLLKKLAYINNPDQVFMESLNLIYKHRGIITIEELLKKVSCNRKTIGTQIQRTYRDLSKKVFRYYQIPEFFKTTAQSSFGSKNF